MPLRLLVTGPPGIGKTTLLSFVLGRLPQGAAVSGFLCRETRGEDGKREAFVVEALDGTATALLASVHGPETGTQVGKYHVQVKDFEDVAVPILDAALAGGSGPRLLIIDEIGGMQLHCAAFVERARRVLTSPDPNLHVLGAVALHGASLIDESKSLPGVEVFQLTDTGRDARALQILQRLCDWLSGGAGDAAAAQQAEGAQARPSGQVEPTASVVGHQRGAAAIPAAPGLEHVNVPRVRFDHPPVGKFSVVYLEDPDCNFASLNAGDSNLYVGGATINRAFRDMLVAVGHDPRQKYEMLHTALLAAASCTPGRLRWIQPGNVDPVALEDCVAFCGLMPADPRIAALRPCGLVSITVFPEGRRPCGADRNVAMVYAVGPHAGATRKVLTDIKLSKDDFLTVVQVVGRAVASAVTQYNAQAAFGPADLTAGVRRVDPEDGKERTLQEAEAHYKGRYKPVEIREYWHTRCRVSRDTLAAAQQQEVRPLPRIERLRVFLLSGGVYKHPEASKAELAAALIRGLLQDGTPGFLLDFTYDEDCFRVAWNELGLPGGDPAPPFSLPVLADGAATAALRAPSGQRRTSLPAAPAPKEKAAPKTERPCRCCPMGQDFLNDFLGGGEPFASGRGGNG